MKLILAEPRGFCAGVERAIAIVERALELYGAPIYVRHEIVHNRTVVEGLKHKGAVFVDAVSDIPDGAITVFSAHGVSEKVESAARLRDLPVIDATCPLVTKVHKEAQRAEREGRQIILIGHAGHPEVEGTSGRVKQKVLLVSSVEDVGKLNVEDPDQLSYVTQTTLSVDDTREIIAALKKRFPAIAGPELRDICYATQNRQDAVRQMAAKVNVMLVVGAANSSNSNRLRDLAEEMGVAAYLIAGPEDIKEEWFKKRVESRELRAEKDFSLTTNSQQLTTIIGLTAGASAPEALVQAVIERLRRLFPGLEVETHTATIENVAFKLPPEVREKKRAWG